jgi:hypothetical protein
LYVPENGTGFFEMLTPPKDVFVPENLSFFVPGNFADR